MALRFARLFSLICLIGTTACEKNKLESCSELTSTASFTVNTFEFNSLEEKAWLSAGTQQSLLFMQSKPNGDQHVVNVIFVGDSVGTYPLLGINASNRASYFAPGINGTTFQDSVIPGTLVLTNFDSEPPCLSGHYSFTVDTLIVSGEFQSLRPN